MSIDLSNIAVDEYRAVEMLCNACPALETVISERFDETTLGELLDRLPALRELDLSHGGGVTGQCFSLLPGSLQRLSVAYCKGLRSVSLRHVGVRCPQLRQLDVSWLNQLDAGDLAAALAGCPQLEWLTARRLLWVPPERYLPPTGLPALTHLDVSRSDGVTDTILRQLPDLLPSLQTLSIAGTLDRLC